jgi:hypothetical protein
MSYAKTLVAIVGAAVTAALGILPRGTTGWTILTIAAAALTAAGVYLVPNTPPVTRPTIPPPAPVPPAA